VPLRGSDAAARMMLQVGGGGDAREGFVTLARLSLSPAL
jgi:hypothetical protein